MAAQAVTEPTGKKIGSTTVGATAGTGLAGAAAVVLVWVLSEIGVNVPTEVAAALAVLIGGVGTLVGGKLTPSNQRTKVVVPVDMGASSQVAPAPGDVEPVEGHEVVWEDSEDAPEEPIVTETVVEVEEFEGK